MLAPYETVINSSSESDSNDDNYQEAADEEVFLKTQDKMQTTNRGKCPLKYKQT